MHFLKKFPKNNHAFINAFSHKKKNLSNIYTFKIFEKKKL